ncbi:MAG TPA: PilZ domain-containing protein [Clostridiales bacterium]|nr:PilZ domain-containing protein [Clostridiales bacterium]
MDERRRAKRMPITLSLEILNLYKQDNVQVSNLHAPIEIVNISKSGIGFVSESVLPVGYYFNANLNLGNSEDTLHCVVKIVRSQVMEDKRTLYGCEFVGMADILSFVFDNYDETIKDEQ